MSLKYLLAFLSVTLIITFILVRSNNREFDHAKQMVALRMIGHELLLHAGDSTSSVLPVKEIGANEYQIRFEHPFAFKTDTLVSIIERAGIAPNYIVNVINCSSKEVIYEYANLDTDIIPCGGRKQQKGCYLISLKYSQARFNLYYLVALIVPCVGGCWHYYRKRVVPVPIPVSVPGIPIGNLLFNNGGQYLVMNDQKITLTSKESRLLHIFAETPNQVIDRSRLQKEVWEDEGVIVGRSLDMFISKLRKKLEADPAVKLVNVHGKGYKLEVNPN